MLYNQKKKLIQKFGKEHPFVKILEFSVGVIKSQIPVHIRYAPDYGRTLRLLEDSQTWNKERLEQFQYEKTLKLLQYAEKNVKWYAKKFAEWEVNSNKFINLSDIKKFPTVTKEEIRDNLQEFIGINVNLNDLMYVTTGGSTGIPFGFYQPFNLEKIDLAFFSHHWGWVNCKIDDLSVVIRGEYIGDEKKLFSYYPLKNEWRFSSYYMTDKLLPRYIEKLNRIKPKFIQAYPSSAEILAKYLLEHNLYLDFELKAVMLGSENVYEEQIESIEKAFKTHVHCWYGQAERVCLAPWTKSSRLYHVFPQYGLTELVDLNNKAIEEEGQIGEIVATGFWNFAMPLIRYRTRDLAVHTNQKSPEGFNYRLFSRIEGRLQELFVTSNGRLISMTAINMHDETFDKVKQFQFYQETPGKLILNIVVKSNFSDEDKFAIEKKLKPKVGKDTELELKIVEEIPRSPSGKMRFLIQKLDIGKWNSQQIITIK